MARMRSPNYPAISLPQAIDLVSKLHSKNRTNSVDRETAAKDLGYTGLNGRTLKLIAALSQYDLIDKSGKGNVKVSKTAVDIMHGLDAETITLAKHQAGNAPPLFQRIFNRFEDGLPSQNAIKSYLIQEGFTDAAIEPVMKSFLETNDYLAQADTSEVNGLVDEIVEKSVMPQSRGTEKVPMINATEAVGSRSSKQPSFSDAGALDFNFTMEGLRVTGATRSPKQLQAFIDKLSALKLLLSADDDPTPTLDELLG
jgi:hypothetical protein